LIVDPLSIAIIMSLFGSPTAASGQQQQQQHPPFGGIAAPPQLSLGTSTQQHQQQQPPAAQQQQQQQQHQAQSAFGTPSAPAAPTASSTPAFAPPTPAASTGAMRFRELAQQSHKLNESIRAGSADLPKLELSLGMILDKARDMSRRAGGANRENIQQAYRPIVCWEVDSG
jgi:hypothetical protein